MAYYFIRNTNTSQFFACQSQNEVDAQAETAQIFPNLEGVELYSADLWVSDYDAGQGDLTPVSL